MTTKLALVVLACAQLQAEVSYIDNGRIRIGIDLDLGGAITYLALSGGDNLINSADFGRQIQQSYYGGPRPFGTPHPAWKNWPWNPIGSGDVYKHRSRVLRHRNTGGKLWVESVPMQWALDNVPCECTVETFIELEGTVARVRSRLNNARKDRTWYGAFDQELPALYTNGPWHHLYSFDGKTVRELVNQGPPWTSWRTPEHWAALVDDKGFGLGVFHPGVVRFLGGFHGKRGSGGPADSATGYIAPVRAEILDHDIRYEYDYRLILGTVDEIRAYARAHAPRQTAGRWEFRRDRQHWTLRDAQDSGWRLKGYWHVRATGPAPRLVAPDLAEPANGFVELDADLSSNPGRRRHRLPIQNAVVELPAGAEARIWSIRLLQP